jgi:hypothetical protein
MVDSVFSFILDSVQFINLYIILPLTLLTFILLLYFVYFLGKLDPDLIKSKIFLRFEYFKQAFIILAIAAFALVFHVILIYLRDFITISSRQSLFIFGIQQLLGLILAILLLLFVYRLFKTIK